MATPKPKIGRVPFREAYDAFERRLKTKIPTESWDEILGETHANGFAVAGATTESLLQDFGESISRLQKEGKSLGDFRKEFDEIVARHGWSYNGERGWRTKVIWETNMRTSYAAGRYAALNRRANQERQKGREYYLIYDTVGDNRVRPAHAAWDGIIRPFDDPFWDTHYPPNGWGCRCSIRTATERSLKTEKLKPTPDNDIPEVRIEDRINPNTGTVYPGQVPGIDTNWNYHVGKAPIIGAAESYGQRIMQAPPEVRPYLLGQSDQFFSALKPAYRSWAKDVTADEFDRGKSLPFMFLDFDVIQELENRQDWITPESAFVSISDWRLRRMLRPNKNEQGVAITESDIDALVASVRNPLAVYYDTEKDGLLYVFQGQGDRGLIKLVIKRGEITSSTSVTKNDMNHKRFKKVKGKL